MTDNNEKDKFAIAYIQQQEQFILNAIRERFNLQIQMSSVSESVEAFKRLYEESQKEVAKQNEIILQATNTIETLTNNLKVCENVSEDRMKHITELNQKLVEFEQMKSVYATTQKELQRVNNELSILHSENEQLSSELSLAKSAISSYDQSSLAKKERPKTKKVTEENSF